MLEITYKGCWYNNLWLLYQLFYLDPDELEEFIGTDSKELGLLLDQVSSTLEFKSSILGDTNLTAFLPLFAKFSVTISTTSSVSTIDSKIVLVLVKLFV